MENLETNSEANSGACSRHFAQFQHQVAAAIRQTAEVLSLPLENESEKTSLGVQTRAWIEGAADQVERFDPAKVKKEFTERIQRNPGTSLLTAAAVGLIFGIVIVRRR